MAVPKGSMFERTVHFAAKWVRASIVEGVHAIGAVSAYVCGKSSFLGRPIDSPHAANEIAFAGLSLPDGVDLDREEAWVELDAFERKSDGSYRRNGGHLPRLGTHIDATLPFGMDDAQARRIVEGFARWLTQTHGVIVEYGCHNAATLRDHAHFLVSTRSMAAGSYGGKVRALNGIAMQHKDRETGTAITQRRDDGSVKAISSAMDEMRAEWARRLGAEIGVTPDHRSFARQGLDIQPVPYVNRRSIEFEKRQSRRTGAEPAWRTDRKRRLAARTQQRAMNSAPRSPESPVVLKPSAVRLGRQERLSPPSTVMQLAKLKVTALRHQILALGRDAIERIRDAASLMQSAGDGRARKTEPRSASIRHNEALTAGFQRSDVSWNIFDNDRLPDDDAGNTADRQRHETRMLSDKHLLSLALVERLASRNALLALRRLPELADRFTADAKALVEKHDEQWATLWTSKRRAWRDRTQVVLPAAHARRRRVLEVPTARILADRRLALLHSGLSRSDDGLRTELFQQAIAADDKRIVQGRTNIDKSTLTALRSVDPRVSKFDPIVAEATERLGSRWQDGVTRLLSIQREARMALLTRYQKREIRLRRDHRHKLGLIERLIRIDALHALRELMAMTIQIARETKLLLDAQGRDWIELLRKHEADWPALPDIKLKPRILHPVITRSGDAALATIESPAFSRPLAEKPASPARQSEDIAPRVDRATPPSSHVRIVDELAVLSILHGRRSDALKQLLAGYVGDDVAEFDRRANERYDLFLQTAQNLGPGKENPLRPRKLRDIAADPLIQRSPELKQLVDGIIERFTKRRTTSQSPKAQRPSAVETVLKSKGKDIV